MNKYLSVLAGVLLLCALPLHSQITYVKQDATGAGDGTSWSDAYTNLHEALSFVESGEIWVASGIYTTYTDSDFFIDRPLALYGGFAGTESSLEERDFEANLTVLSADVEGDDLPGEFEQNRADNSAHVIFIFSSGPEAVIIDGFTISGGHASLTDDIFFPEWAGGGLFTFGRIQVENCHFTGNQARSGACIAIYGETASLSTIRNSTFEGNLASSQSAGILVEDADAVLVESCIFRNNETNRGCVYPFSCDGFILRDCQFYDNLNPDGFGAAAYAWQPTNMRVEGCTFERNQAANASCFYIDQRDLAANDTNSHVVITDCTLQENQAAAGFGAGLYTWQPKKLEIDNIRFSNNSAANAAALYIDQRTFDADSSSILISDCFFEENASPGFGGAGLYAWNSSFTLARCAFVNNTAGPGAGGVLIAGASETALIDSCSFYGNSAEFAGAIANYASLSKLTLRRSLFVGNNVSFGGGALSVGFTGRATVEDCRFEENRAGFGGAIFVQDDSSALSVANTAFTNNTARTSDGGAILNISGNTVTIDGCLFELNTAALNGGAITAVGNALEVSKLHLSNSVFNFNLSDLQGGALNTVNVGAQIANCLFSNNSATGLGVGGTISLNALAEDEVEEVEVGIINTTFADNQGDFAAGIAAWTDDVAQLTTSVQNNLFANQTGLDYLAEGGSPILISNGGNFTLLDFQSDTFNHPADIIGGDPLFANLMDFDYRILNGSPCIDAGVEEGAPAFDLDGNPRVDAVDIGAYENQKISNAAEVSIFDLKQLRLFPNPATAETSFQIDNPWKGDLIVRLVTTSGVEAGSWSIHKTANSQAFPIDVSSLPAAVYHLLVSDGKTLLGAHLVKQ